MLNEFWPYAWKAVVGVLIGLGILSTPLVPNAAHEDYSMASSLPPPQSLAEIVDRAPLIFIGEIGPVDQYLDFVVYGDDGQMLKERPVHADGNPTGDVPATDFLLKVEKVIRDDGRVARGEPIILREGGTITEELKKLTQGTEYEITFTGDRYLFLLIPTPDGLAYGFYYGPWSRLIVDGDTLRISDDKRQPLQFGDDAKPITLDEFIQFVESRKS